MIDKRCAAAGLYCVLPYHRLLSSIAVYVVLLSCLPYIGGEQRAARYQKLQRQKNTNVPICFSWLNCALQGIEAMFWVSMRLFEACVTDV